MTALQNLLTQYKKASQTQREKGTYFEELTCLRSEGICVDLGERERG